jgi:ATP-independent RNA helicase DbpA
MSTFSTLPLSEAMQENLKSLQYLTMTEIQKASIPSILEGKDVLAQAKTGSGKTAAFGIGLMENLNTSEYRVQALALCPTRELASQVAEELRRLARFKHNIKVVSLAGGSPMSRQELSLRHQAHIVIGTPGRVLKLLQRGSLVLRDVTMLVLDEADRMLAMGFVEQIADIFRFAPEKRQTLCFSATFPEGVRNLSKSLQNHPKEITVETQLDTSVLVQEFYGVPEKDKARAVLELLAKHQPKSTLVFCNTKDQCRFLQAELTRAGLHCLAIHGDLEQRERTEVLIRFSNGSTSVLIATDVAGRGIDIDSLGAVINYDLPFEPEAYVHRIGRTGRAGSSGLAFSLVAAGEEFRVREINDTMGTEFSVKALGFQDSRRALKLEPVMVTLSINGGRKNKISRGDVLGALTSKEGIPGADVGKIDRMDHLTFIAVKRESARKALEVLQNAPIKGRRFLAILNE